MPYRIYVTERDTHHPAYEPGTNEVRRQLGYFFAETAECYHAANDPLKNDINTHSVDYHERLIHTGEGHWVLQEWCTLHRGQGTYRWVTPDEARDWLERNNQDRAVARYFHPLGEHSADGAPLHIGNQVTVSLGTLLPLVDDMATGRNISRGEMLRRMVLAFANTTWQYELQEFDRHKGVWTTLQNYQRKGDALMARAVELANQPSHVLPDWQFRVVDLGNGKILDWSYDRVGKEVVGV